MFNLNMFLKNVDKYTYDEYVIERFNSKNKYKTSGIYIFLLKGTKKIVRVGISTNLYSRLNSHYNPSGSSSFKGLVIEAMLKRDIEDDQIKELLNNHKRLRVKANRTEAKKDYKTIIKKYEEDASTYIREEHDVIVIPLGDEYEEMLESIELQIVKDYQYNKEDRKIKGWLGEYINEPLIKEGFMWNLKELKLLAYKDNDNLYDTLLKANII